MLQLVKSLPFYVPEACKRYPFRAEPTRIGHFREYPPSVHAHVADSKNVHFLVFDFLRRCRKSLDLVLLVLCGQQTQLHIIACFASFESSRQFSLFIIVSIFSISEKKSLGFREYLNFAAFSDDQS